jgi:ribosomal subunit interface protein
MTVPIEFHLDNIKISEQLSSKVRDHIDEWSRGHHDISKVYVSLKQLSGKKTVHVYEAKIVLYHRPGNLVASQKSTVIPNALTGAIQAIERQLREHRSAFRDRRKKRKFILPEEPLTEELNDISPE